MRGLVTKAVDKTFRLITFVICLEHCLCNARDFSTNQSLQFSEWNIFCRSDIFQLTADDIRPQPHPVLLFRFKVIRDQFHLRQFAIPEYQYAAMAWDIPVSWPASTPQNTLTKSTNQWLSTEQCRFWSTDKGMPVSGKISRSWKSRHRRYCACAAPPLQSTTITRTLTQP
jgi:hypothetical protein